MGAGAVHKRVGSKGLKKLVVCLGAGTHIWKKISCSSGSRQVINIDISTSETFP